MKDGNVKQIFTGTKREFVKIVREYFKNVKESREREERLALVKSTKGGK